MALDSYLKKFQIVNKNIRPPDYQGAYDVPRFDYSDSDESRYILKPDSEFDRPWLASPSGNSGLAFIWPLGVEGFSLASNASAGVHHYIGDNGVYVDVVYPDEYHIILNGNFPGDTSATQVNRLRNVILHQNDPPGKILGIRPIQDHVLFVAAINHSFSHPAGESDSNIQYSIEFIKMDLGAKIQSTVTKTPKNNPTSRKRKGKSHRRHRVRSGARTLSAVSSLVYGSTDTNLVAQLYNLNSGLLDSLGIPMYKMTYAQLPTGTVVDY